MKALSIRQPWAELILQGRKTIELRTWSTPYRGRLLIHAGKKVDYDDCGQYGLDPASLTTGALVGTVELTGIRTFNWWQWRWLRKQHLGAGPFYADVLGWELSDPQRLAEPVPYRGQLRLFNVDDELLAG
jgi:hypothetical protein